MLDVKMLDTKIDAMKQVLSLLALKLPGASLQRCNLVQHVVLFLYVGA